MEDGNKAELIKLEQVSFVYDGDMHPVWQGLNCSFQEGTINLLLGPSGCGKSTLLQMLNGIVPHFYEGKVSGNIWFKGLDILTQKTRDLVPYIGMVFQNPEAQFCTFTVEDELAFGLENQGAQRETIQTAIEETLDMVGMTGMERSLLSELSGGQKQKIAIASVLIMNTAVIVLDEPTANLDAISRGEIFALLEQLVEQGEKTIILVEHNLEHLLDKVGHVIVFDNYKNICMEGSTKKVFRRLIYHPDYEELNLFLPEKYMIIKQWLSHMRAYPEVQVFREKWSQETGETAALFQEEAFIELWNAQRNVMTDEVEIIQQIEVKQRKLQKRELIQIQNLQYQYKEPVNGEATLRGVNVTIDSGEFVALIGANGAGKSTFLKVMFCALLKYRGIVKVRDIELQEWNKKDLYRQMGLVFQNPEDQFVTNVVYDELLFSLKQSEESDEEKQKRLEELLIRFHLLEEKQKSPFLLSQGQKRRLSVATMLLTGQNILFLDEPTYGQDYDNQKELMELMAELNQAGVTIIVVTHDMSLVADYADKVVVLSEGKTEFCGKPEDVFDNIEAIEKGRLEVPEAYHFSKKLHKIEPRIPVCFSGKQLVEYLLKNRGKEA